MFEMHALHLLDDLMVISIFDRFHDTLDMHLVSATEINIMKSLKIFISKSNSIEFFVLFSFPLNCLYLMFFLVSARVSATRYEIWRDKIKTLYLE